MPGGWLDATLQDHRFIAFRSQSLGIIHEFLAWLLYEPTLKSPEMSILGRNLCAAAPRPLRGGVGGWGRYLSAAE